MFHEQDSQINASEVKLLIGSNLIVVEKRTLSNNSPYFASLQGFHDVSLNALPMSPPQNVGAENFLAVLNSLSNSSSELNIGAINVWDFVILSVYFQLNSTQDRCYNVLVKLLPASEMDELCYLWRMYEHLVPSRFKSLLSNCISLKMESALQSRAFFDLTVEELAALMSDDGFLPLIELTLCQAVLAWFEHDPQSREKPEVFVTLLSHFVWNESTNSVLAPFVHFRKSIKKPPKRQAMQSQENPGLQLLAAHECDGGIVVGDYFYGVRKFGKWDRSFHRINITNGESIDWDRLDPIHESDTEPAQYRLCAVALPGHQSVGFLLSSWMAIQYRDEDDGFDELRNTVALYDTMKNEWIDLPCLPFPRTNTAMIQCGTHLYIIGGVEYRPYQSGLGNCHRCYRLDLNGITDGMDDEFQGKWVRIADLNCPRIKHCVKIEYGRIVVHGGQTETGMNGEGDKTFEDAHWSEAYDTVLNTWTMFGST